MSVKIGRIAGFMEQWAPCDTASDFDNVGLLVGDAERETERVLVALDATSAVIAEAAEKECGLIVTHHPLFLRGLKRINAEHIAGRRVIALIENGIALYAAHTNLDKAKGGVNDTLCERLGLTGFETVIGQDGQPGFLRVAELAVPVTVGGLADSCAEALSLPMVRIIGDEGRIVRRLAVCSGNGMSLLGEVAGLSVDLFVSGDIRYHDAIDAQEYGIAMIDLTHYASEAVIVECIKAYLERKRDENGLVFEVDTISSVKH